MNFKIELPVNNKAFDDMAEQNNMMQWEYTELLECVNNVKLLKGVESFYLHEIVVYDLSNLINYNSISVDQAIENINNKILNF